MPELLLPPRRLERWLENFAASHGATSYLVRDGVLLGEAPDGSWFRARLPFDRRVAGEADPAALLGSTRPPPEWGILLVRKGGFAVARLREDRMSGHKIGQRHVQGRTKAGGQSQQRFARRRQEQARVAYRAAADHAARILDGLTGPVATGGDRAAIEEVFGDDRLRGLSRLERFLDVPDPKRAVLDAAVRDACALAITVHNAG